MSTHRCHAEACNLVVPPVMFMCRMHWYMIPKPLRDKIWSYYVPKQEERKDPSPEYLAAAREAIEAVAQKERL